MTPELSYLFGAIVVGLVHIAAQAAAQQWNNGIAWGAGARDTGPARPSGSPLPGRLTRALRNFGETFPLFAAAVLGAGAAGLHTPLTHLGAGLYVWGRVAYLPLYALGVPYVRSLAWGIATLGIVLIVVAVLA